MGDVALGRPVRGNLKGQTGRIGSARWDRPVHAKTGHEIAVQSDQRLPKAAFGCHWDRFRNLRSVRRLNSVLLVPRVCWLRCALPLWCFAKLGRAEDEVIRSVVAVRPRVPPPNCVVAKPLAVCAGSLRNGTRESSMKKCTCPRRASRRSPSIVQTAGPARGKAATN